MPRPLDVLDQIRALMERGHIPPTPTNYETCYRYVTSADPELWQQVNAAIEAEGYLSAGALARIQDRQAQTSEAPGSPNFLKRVGKELAEVRSYLKDASGKAGTYRSALKRGRSEFDLVESEDDDRAGQLLAKLAQATDEMMTQAAALNEKLEKSGAQVATMNDELEKARRETLRDALTGLPNRRAFDLQIVEELKAAKKAGRSLTLAFCDVDHFKKFNDTWGHRIGDDVLRLVGVRMIDGFKDKGFSARYGGEEFVTLLPGIHPDEAMALANMFRQSISARALKMRGDGRDIGRVTVSVGIAVWAPGESLDAFVERADAALYQAKRDGRDRCVFAQDAVANADAMSLALAS